MAAQAYPTTIPVLTTVETVASPAPEVADPTTAGAPPPLSVATPTGMPGAPADGEGDPQLDAQLLPEVFEHLGTAVSSSATHGQG